MNESIKWIDAKAEKPDESITVLIFGGGHKNSAMEDIEVWVGYFDSEDGLWRLDSGERAGTVTHWAEMPEGPQS